MQKLTARFIWKSAISRSYATQNLVSLYTLTDEERALKDAVAKFSNEIIKPKVFQMDEQEKTDKSVIQGLFENGLMGIETEEKYGGTGASFMSCILAIEELSKVDPSIAVMVGVQNNLVGRLLNLLGTQAQKEKYLGPLVTSKLGSFCLSEATSGSDAFALKTRATKVGNKYVLNGSKMWITNSFEAEIFLVFANVAPEKGYKGITCFIVEKDMGVKIAKKEIKLGIKASSTCELSFEDVQVPEENILGEVGKGYKYAIANLNEGRIGIASQMVGLAQGAYDNAVRYAYQRQQFGRPVAENQGMQFQMAQVYTEIEAARLLTYNAARLREQGQDLVMQAAMAKLFASQVAERAASKAIEFVGGVGFTREFPLEKFFRDSKIGAIYEGTSNIQLQTIAKLLKPKYE